MKTVLIVEADENQRLLYRWELEDAGYRVIAVADADEADRVVLRQAVDCIVLGVGLRCRTVPERAEGLLRRERTAPVVINTAFGDCGGASLASLADDCVVKSSDPGQLRQHIQALTDG